MTLSPSLDIAAHRPPAAPVVGIDASRSRSGGAKTHLLGILSAVNPTEHGIAEVHVWSYPKLLQTLPDAPWLIKHAPPALERSLPHQFWWQFRQLPRELKRHGCQILLSTDAGSVCRYAPNVVMSRDMLSFEGREMQRYAWYLPARWRLGLLKRLQVSSLRRATGALFLTHYAAEVIQRFTGTLKWVRVIPHGIAERFRQQTHGGAWAEPATEIRCVYVSNTDLYKHQWHVVDAVGRLRQAGHAVTLRLVGGGHGPAQKRLHAAVQAHDPRGEFVLLVNAVAHDDIPAQLASTDIFIFASSCENMPNTLVEAMAAGLPIACARRGPMPDILQDAGTYFDPEDPESIASAVATLLTDRSHRLDAAQKAKTFSNAYAWTRCASETWGFLAAVFQAHKDAQSTVPDTPLPSTHSPTAEPLR